MYVFHILIVSAFLSKSKNENGLPTKNPTGIQLEMK